MAYGVITLGREICSGGCDIAKEAARELGLPYYDKELITIAAKKSGLSEEAIAASEKRRTGSLMYSLYTMGNQLPLADQVFILQSRIIKEIAEKGPCVIVGRCADYVLRDMDHVTHIFLYASLEKRVERIMRLEHVDADKARELIRKTDKQRKSYYNFFADGNWGVRSNYDLMLRTDDHTPEEIAEMIIAYAHPGK